MGIKKEQQQLASVEEVKSSLHVELNEDSYQLHSNPEVDIQPRRNKKMLSVAEYASSTDAFDFFNTCPDDVHMEDLEEKEQLSKKKTSSGAGVAKNKKKRKFNEISKNNMKLSDEVDEVDEGGLHWGKKFKNNNYFDKPLPPSSFVVSRRQNH